MSWRLPQIAPAVVAAGFLSALAASATGQTPASGAAVPMRPYGTLAGCSEEPARFHACALDKARTYNPPRTPDGQPDFRGHWNRARVTSDNIEEHLEVVGDPGGKSLIVDPPDGRIPYQTWALAKRADNARHYIAPQAMCLQPGSPRGAYAPGGYQIMQTRASVIFLHDFSHSYRVIYTDGRPHIPGGIRLAMGDSRGRWEGNTLVVDATNYNAKTWLDNEGNFFSDRVHIVERWTLIAPDALHYSATIGDPRVYTRPWTLAFGIRRNADPAYELWESACHEGNRGELPGSSVGLKPYPGLTLPD
ncbi:MAG: hypothetical protein HYY76_18120 [Acidobacteria bacterium]|nr:hypothetical protein [Acidobacteriota bacterium]